MSRPKQERDDAILHHLGQYGLSIRHVISHRFFAGLPAGNTLQRLAKAGKIVSRRKLPQRRCYYQLSRSEAAARSFPVSRTDALDGANLNRRLAILWFCTMNARRRHGQLPEDVCKLLQRAMPNRPHCVEHSSKGRWRLLRLKVISPDSQPGDVVDWVREKIRQDREHTIHREWLEARQYGYAILVDDPTEDHHRVKGILEKLKDAKLFEGAHLLVEFTPSAETLHMVLTSTKK